MHRARNSLAKSAEPTKNLLSSPLRAQAGTLPHGLDRGQLAGLFAMRVACERCGRQRSAGPTARVAKSVRVVERSFQLTRPDQKERLTVGCPGHSMPLGGGMSSYPPPGAGGEGVYPRSYERLGVQGGWHVTAVLYDPTPRRTQGREVTVQVACGPKIGHVTPPHATKFVKPGRTKTATATCRGRGTCSPGASSGRTSRRKAATT